MNDLIVLKLGGSSITKKADNKFEMDYEILERAAKEIAKAKKQKKFDLIVACGVGPFGHTNVKKFDLNNGIKTPEQEKGVEQTIKDCDFVADEVMNALEKAGLKTIHVPGYLVSKQDNKKTISFDIEPYKKALKGGKIPVTTGNMVKDKSLKWSVMSGDKVLAYTSKLLKPKRVLVGTNVDGIFTADPTLDPKAKLVPEINKQNLNEVLEMASSSNAVDVTGGMKGKLEQISQQLSGTPTEIFNLFVEGNLEKALLEQKIKSTKVLL
jgi:isopentenyl phosphate kinase